MLKNNHLNLTKDQRKGILALCLLIVGIQIGYYFISRTDFSSESGKSEEEKQWLALQSDIDALKAKKGEKQITIYPFNPNFISDYKGYTLGMSTVEIDRLHAFRKSGKWINSPADFKTVTKVPDSLLLKLSPYFKFPDWVVEKNQQRNGKNQEYATAKTATAPYHDKFGNKKATIVKPAIDINSALEEDLIVVYGIGPSFAKKILRHRADLGAFVSMDQMEDFDFSPEALAGLRKGFKVGDNPKVTTINVNTASLQQLSRFPYFNRDIAKAIITQRSTKGKIDNFNELSNFKDIFTLKSKIIRLYLEY
jgi:DNA uptake protein ComE-like DNA-binding protein